MAKSHKLLLAVVLLVGGYGAAMLLGSLNRWIVPDSADHAVAGVPGGALVPMTDEDASITPPLPLPQVPVTSAPVASRTDRGAATSMPMPPASVAASPAPPAMPTWLAAAPEAKAMPIVSAAPASAKPLAKVTNISPWGDSQGSEASPWDRWPQWDPQKAASNNTVTAPLGSPAQSAAVQASYRPNQPTDGDANSENAGNSDLRTHIVVDGDSLSKLADRYLDDPNKANEIYELNRAVLNSPELLPIGVELRIPSRTATIDQFANNLPRAIDVSHSHAPHRFEPAENWLDAANDVPRAQLLQPMPIGRSD